MNEYLLRRFTPTESLNKILPIIKEAFIEFYGEDKRKYIEEKFDNIILLGSFNPESIDILIHNLYRDYTKNLLGELCSEFDIENSSEFLKKHFGDDCSFEYIVLMPINKYREYKNSNDNNNPYIKKEAVSYLQTFDLNVNDENIDEYMKLGKFDYLDMICLKADELLDKYQEFKSKFKPYAAYVDDCKILKSNSKDKYMKKLIMEFADFVPAEELKNYFDGNFPTTFPYLRAFVGYNINDTSCIDCFSEANERLLLNGKEEWKKDSVKSARIEYFKLKGINLGNDYEAYKSSNECSAVIPSQDLINKIAAAKLKHEESFQNDYYTSIQEYKENRELIDKQNLICKNDSYNAGIFMHKGTFVSPNIKVENGQPVLYPLININFDSILDTHDVGIIHEFNHLYELSLLDINKNSVDFLCGWDFLSKNLISDSSITKLEKNNNKREYELFNEIINEIIAQKISTIIQNKGIHFFNSPEKAKIKGETSYERTLFLVRDFYDEFESDIIQSREEGNISHIFDVVGKENFDYLNELFHIFNERWSGFKYYSLVDDLLNNVETEETKIYFELIEKCDAILNKMREHKALYEKNSQAK